MRFREIEPSDIPELFRVRRATWHTDNAEAEMTALGITPDAVEELMRAGSHQGWLCELAGEVVGFAMGDRVSGEMWVIAVLREHEGKGIGKKLLSLVEDWLFSAGWDRIWLTTDPDETVRAVGFYRRLGWSDWKFDERQNRYMRKKRPE